MTFEYVSRLRERRDEAIELQYLEVTFVDGTSPEPNKCHENVEKWVFENPGAEAVRGWLITGDFIDLHSVVRDGGRLIDITRRCRSEFLPLEGAEAEFEQLRRECRNQLQWSHDSFPFEETP